MTIAVGIDLGTTYTVVATLENGRPKVLANAEGSCLTPSVVCFDGAGKPLVGEAAKRAAASMPNRAVFSIKRRMGSDYGVVLDGRDYSAQDISSLVLRKVKADVEAHLGEQVGQAVITVPAYFNDRQRQATRQAGALAGLEVMKIINEPTAAALAYGLHKEDAHTVLVWDLGGGTFDVSILELGEDIFEVRAVSGDTWLGGDDFDVRIADHLAELYRNITGADFPTDLGARQRLKETAERAKIALSYCSAVVVQVPRPDSRGPRCLEVELTREQLESLTGDLLQRMVAPTHEALAGAGLSAAELDRVLLVGGATRMPAVRALARQLFGIEPYRYIHPDYAVALGAAIQAGMLLGLVEKVVLLDVLPLSLGIESMGGLMARIISRNTPLPASGSHIFTTAADYQTSMSIHVLQGERAVARDNISLGQFDLSDIATAPRGVPKVEVAFQVDEDGIVNVSATDLLTGAELHVKVTSTKFLDPREIDNLAEEAARNEEGDRETRQRVEGEIEAQNLLVAAESVLQDMDGQANDASACQIFADTSKLREAMAVGDGDDMRACADAVRRMLATLQKKKVGV